LSTEIALWAVYSYPETFSNTPPGFMNNPDIFPLVRILICALSLVHAVRADDEDPAADIPDLDKIVLTTPDFPAAGQRMDGPVEFCTKSFVLRMSAEGKPVSIKTVESGEELLDSSIESEGFYLECRSGKIHFAKLSRRADGKFVVLTRNETQRVIFSVAEKGEYLTFKIEELYGIPSRNNFTLHFGLHGHGRIRYIPLDYMTSTGNDFPVNWRWIWRRGSFPLGSFALYHKTSDEQEDDMLFRVWVDEELPHPKIDGEWTLERARRWVREWIEVSSDGSLLWYPFPQNEEELYELIPLVEKAGLREVHLMPWTWVDGRHHCWVSDKVFKDGRQGLKKFSEFLKARGMRLTLHYNFCEIRFNDPVFVGTKPDDGLAGWGTGKLVGNVGESDTQLVFRPDPGVELPFIMDPWHYDVLPPALGSGTPFNFVQIDNEIIRVGEFLNTNTDTWVLRDCERGLGSTESADHTGGARMKGLAAMFGQFFIPQTDHELFDIMTSEMADLMNECGISHVEYDGVNPAVWAANECAYQKWLSESYAKIDHPTTFGSGYGAAGPPFGHFEYRLNAVKKLKLGGLAPRGDMGARIRTHHVSRPASTLDEAHYRMSQLAARGIGSFPLFFAVHYPSQWREHGLLDPICDVIGNWKAASKQMTDGQRARILKTLHEPITRGYQSDTIWRLRKDQGAYRITPSKNPLTRRKGDVFWGCQGAEAGYVMPCQYIKPGDVLELENPYDAQPPQFVIQVMSATDYLSSGNIELQPAAGELQNPSEMKVTADAGGLVLTAENRLGEDDSNKDQNSLMPMWKREVDMSAHRPVGMWVTGDGSGSVLVLRLPHVRDYAVTIDFDDRRYVEIPNGEVFWADANWGGPLKCDATAWNYHPDWLKIGFGKIPARTAAKVAVAGLKALRELPSRLVNPVIGVNDGELRVRGVVETDQYLAYDGGDVAVVYDKNWNEIRELDVDNKGYVMPRGYHRLSVSTKQPEPLPWMAVRFITEGEGMTVPFGAE
jgi:hypothetical protein